MQHVITYIVVGTELHGNGYLSCLFAVLVCKCQPHIGLLNLEIIGNDERRSSSLVYQPINHHWLWQLIYLDWRKRYYNSSFLAGTRESII
jgi:hypothetical protein